MAVSAAPGALVLIVEDEALIALTMEEALLGAGFRVCGIADTASRALALAARHKPGLAVIDVRLAGGDDGIQVAEALVARRPTGILFATGNCAEVRQRARVGQGCLSKPFEAAWLVAALRAVQVAHAALGQPSSTVPGFTLLPAPGP